MIGSTYLCTGLRDFRGEVLWSVSTILTGMVHGYRNGGPAGVRILLCNIVVEELLGGKSSSAFYGFSCKQNSAGAVELGYWTSLT